MKPDFVVSRATSKTFKTFCLYSQGHLTFMENPIIRIAAKFQFNIPSLRTLAVMDTISWSRGRLHRKSCTFLRRSWIRKVAIDVNTFFRPPLKNWCWKPFSGMLVLLFLLLSMMTLFVWFTCPPTIHFKFTTKCDKCYCKVRQLKLLQSAMICYCKVRQIFYYKVQ